jgi:hypothetical protein
MSKHHLDGSRSTMVRNRFRYPHKLFKHPLRRQANRHQKRFPLPQTLFVSLLGSPRRTCLDLQVMETQFPGRCTGMRVH